MIQQNGQPAQVVQIQRTSDDRCEIIVQPTEMQDTTTHYYTEDGMKKIVQKSCFSTSKCMYVCLSFQMRYLP